MAKVTVVDSGNTPVVKTIGLPGIQGPSSGGTGSGITQTQADARYVKLAQINAPFGVAGLDSNKLLDEVELPLPPVTLTVLFQNKLI